MQFLKYVIFFHLLKYFLVCQTFIERKEVVIKTLFCQPNRVIVFYLLATKVRLQLNDIALLNQRLHQIFVLSFEHFKF